MVRADLHIDVDSLIRDNLKRPGLRAEVSQPSRFVNQAETIASTQLANGPCQ